MAQAALCLPFPVTAGGGDCTDVALMARLGGGDVEAMEPLMERHRRGIRGYLYRMVQDSAAAEDLTQEVFLRLYLARGRYEASARFTTWLYRIATNLALNWVRDHRHDRRNMTVERAPQSWVIQRALTVTVNPERMVLREERRRRVREAVEVLPQRQRAVVLMHKYSELRYEEIAEVLDISLSAVKALLNRAYGSLRSSLPPDCAAEA